jgi:hypothetical protein
MRFIPARGGTRVSVPRLLTSAAVAGSLAGAASEAQADIIRYDLNPPDGVAVFDNEFQLDIDGDFVFDFTFRHSGYGGFSSLIDGTDPLDRNVVWLNDGTPQFAEPFTNDAFNRTGVSGTTADFFRSDANVGNPWPGLGADGYVNGLFDRSSTLHTFWVRMSVDQFNGGLVLREVAWESDEYQPPAPTVPEPATLALLALGAAGAAAVRRRSAR